MKKCIDFLEQYKSDQFKVPMVWFPDLISRMYALSLSLSLTLFVSHARQNRSLIHSSLRSL